MDFELKDISTWSPWGRYLAQDADGYWCIYKNPPIFWKPGYWKNPPSTEKDPEAYRWCAVCKTERIKNNEIIVIDLNLFKETYGS